MKAFICGSLGVVWLCNGMQTTRLRTNDNHHDERITVHIRQEVPSTLSTSVYDGLVECVICAADTDEKQLIAIPCIHRHTELICAACLDHLSCCPLCRSPLKQVEEEVSCFSCFWGK